METADPLEVEEFLSLLRISSVTDDEGNQHWQTPMGEMTAAMAVGWTPRKLKALKRDPEFVQLMTEAKELVLEAVESVEIRNALRGNQRAIEMYLFCHGQHRGWKPPTQRHEHKSEGRIEVNVVASIKEAVKAHALNGDIPVAQLQLAPPIDAEIVEPDDN